jgi:glycosyltransferase involved in cell wall biosynthesis
LYSGVFVHGDAVSNSLLAKLRILRGLRLRGAPVGVQVFAHGTDYTMAEVEALPSVTELLRRDAFWDSDFHIFEFGIYYELFNAVFAVPEGRPILVVEHNSTPPELVDTPMAKRACEQSLVQRHNLARATHVACDSEFNRDLARSIGIPDDRLSVLHLPPAHRPVAPALSEPAPPDAPVHLLYVGRFVRAKGVADLLEAMSRVWDGGLACTLTLAGNPTWSDPAVLDAVDRAVARYGPSGRLRLESGLDDAEVSALFARADALVIPSYHEGYCVPVVEAFSAGCFAVGYDAGNLPNVTGGLGSLVPCGDVDALGAAIERFVRCRMESRAPGAADLVPADRGDLRREEWAAAVREHLTDYSETAYERRFLELFGRLARDRMGPGVAERVAVAVAERDAELAMRP